MQLDDSSSHGLLVRDLQIVCLCKTELYEGQKVGNV